MKKSKQTFTVRLTILLLLLVVMLLISIVCGAANISIMNVIRAIFTNEVNDQILIIRELRLPRELAALFVGAALAVSGAIMQGVTRNPLADPSLLGLTSGANMALAIVLATAVDVSFMSLIIICFIGAALGAALVFGIGSLQKGGFTPVRLVLSGAAVSTFLYAISQGVAINFHIAKDVSMWTSGGFVGTTWDHLSLVIPIIVIGVVIAIICSKQVTILSLSEEIAIGLGQKTILMKLLLFTIVVALAGVSVALAGNLVFIGLMIPHIARALVGVDYRFVIPASAVLGAVFMLLADTVGRVINAPFETSIAAIVALMGIPFFIFIVNRGVKGI